LISERKSPERLFTIYFKLNLNFTHHITSNLTSPTTNTTPTAKLSKPPISHKSKKRSFLSIPPESRNSIYEYHYAGMHHIELMPKNAAYHVAEVHTVDLKKAFKLDAKEEAPKRGIRCGKLLGKFTRAEGMKTRWHLSISGLHLANKQIYHECIVYLYASVAIFAQSSRRLENFLTAVPKKSLIFITRLKLDHQTYGHPRDAKMEVWKRKADERWMETCKLAVRRLSGLRELEVNVDVRDIPLRFTLHEKWVRPLLFFAHRKNTLRKTVVNVFTPEIRNTAVDVYSDQWVGYMPWYVRMLVERHEGVREMYRLFGKAIAKRIGGMCEDCALEEYREVLEGRLHGFVHQHASNSG
jgi:hypothetical protein